MDPNSGRGDSRYNLNYSMSMMNEQPEIYGNPNVSLARPGSGLSQVMSRGGGLMPTNNTQCGGGLSRGIKRTNSDCFDDRSGGGGLGGQSQYDCSINDVTEESYTQLQPKKSPPSNGKKTKGRVKIKMEYIDNKLRRYTTFSKRKTGIMKKAYELSTLTGTQVMLLVASETGHVYTFATRKLQPMITSEAGKALIQTCLNSPDPPTGASDQRMSATGFEETELSYNIGDEDSKDDRSPLSSDDFDEDDSGPDSPGPSNSQLHNNQQQQPSMGVDSDSINDSLNLTTTTTVASNKQQTGGGPVPQTLSTTSLALHQQQQQQQQQQQLQQKLMQQQKQQAEHHQPAATLTPITTTSSSGTAATAGNGLAGNSILYPASAFANLPQDILVSLVQSGQLQIHTDQDGAHQYITIPLSMMPGGVGGGGGPGGGGAGNGSAQKSTNPVKTSTVASTTTTTNGSKSTSSSSAVATQSAKNEMNIKTEIID